MPCKILVVEDDATTAMVICAALRREFPDSEISTVGTLTDTLRVIRSEHPPEIVMLDLTLADATHLETLAHLDEIHRRSQVVIASGHSPESIRATAAESAEGVTIIEKQRIAESGLIASTVRAAMALWSTTHKLDQTLCEARCLLNTPPNAAHT